MLKRLTLILCASALSLAATGLDALRAQLAKAGGPEALKASVDFQTWSRRGDEKKPVIAQGKATAWVETGPQGLRILWSRDQVQQVLRELQLRNEDPEKTTPTRDAMTGLDVLSIQSYLDPAPRLLQDLDQAQLVEERPDTLDGRPLKLLTLKLEPRLGARDKKYVKELEATAKVWVDADGNPVAAHLHTKVKGKALLVISFASEAEDDYRYGRSNGRLVTLRHSQEQSSSGGGESGQTRKVAVLDYH